MSDAPVTRSAHGRLLPAVLVATLLAVVLLLPATASRPASAAGGCDGVTVRVERSGRSSERCAPGDPGTGLEALETAGHRYTFVPGQPGMVCTIDGFPEPCNDAPADAYWSYWHADAGATSWTYATRGAGARDPAPGTHEAWVFGAGDAPRDPPPAPAPTPSPTPTRTPAPASDDGPGDTSDRPSSDGSSSEDRSGGGGDADDDGPPPPAGTSSASGSGGSGDGSGADAVADDPAATADGDQPADDDPGPSEPAADGSADDDLADGDEPDDAGTDDAGTDDAETDDADTDDGVRPEALDDAVTVDAPEGGRSATAATAAALLVVGIGAAGVLRARARRDDLGTDA